MEIQHASKTAFALSLVEECLLEKDIAIHNALIFANREKILKYNSLVTEVVLAGFPNVSIAQRLMSTTSSNTLGMLASEQNRSKTKNFSTVIFSDPRKELYNYLKGSADSSIIQGLKSFGYIEDIIINEAEGDSVAGFYVWIKITNKSDV
jgi:hypothetical protein